MRCPRCHFENMPGRDRCFQCNSVLEIQGAIDIHPPRMPSWQRSFRVLSRWFRDCIHRSTIDEQEKEDRKTFTERFPIEGFIFGIVPGLPFIVSRRFREVCWVWMGWWLALLLAAWMYASPWGWSLLGLAAAMHAWMYLKYLCLEQYYTFLERMVTVLIMVLLFVGAYIAISRLILYPYMIFRRTAINIPYHNIQRGDLLLLRYVTQPDTILERGTIVWYTPRSVNQVEQGNTMGQIIGLPGERVQVDNQQEHFVVSGQILDAERYVVPNWLKRQKVNIRVGQDQYFIAADYRVYGQGNILPYIKTICVVKQERIHARATRLWWPLSRRQRLE